MQQLCVLATLLCMALSLSSKDKSKNSKANQSKESVFERGLVTSSVSAASIIEHHGQAWVKASKNFEPTVLAYVTPWNGKGYEVAETRNYKFDVVSPVWLQLKPKGSKGKVTITGTHDVDQGWIGKLRNNKTSDLGLVPRVLPRVLFDGWTGESLVALFKSESKQKKAATLITDECVKRKFDGIVLEVLSQLGGASQLITAALRFVKVLGETLHSSDLQLILVVPPMHPNQPPPFTEQMASSLANTVDYFSLMTYDYPKRPGPNAPLPWVRECVLAIAPKDNHIRQKILLGLNFYGNDYSNTADSILGPKYIELLTSHHPTLVWEPEHQEHVFMYRDKNRANHEVFYPTLHSVHARLELARELHTGISIWEIGQGLDYFYDLL